MSLSLSTYIDTLASLVSSSRTPKIWRVVINKKRWAQAEYEHLCTLEPERKLLPQSRGRVNMRKVPSAGDIVLFVIKGVIVMIGTVKSDGFLIGTAHQHHPCNREAIRPHAEPTYYAEVNILQFVSILGLPHKGQQTWIEVSRDEIPVAGI